MQSNDAYYLLLSHCPGIGPITFDLLTNHFGSVEAASNASLQELSHLIGSALALRFTSFRSSFDAEKELQIILKKNITLVTREHPSYPHQLLQLSDAPICLYVKGNISEFDWKSDLYIGVVGTRKPTEYGTQITRLLSRELAQAGIIIVSGLALGVDALAHLEAVKAGKKTIAFLGCGVNIIYPSTNADLYSRILEMGGLIISEFPPDAITLKGHFVARNRLISGLSQGILVTEGLIHSGALITARYALQQGKDVFAPPSPITSEYSGAPNLLLKEGAILVTSADDILREYGKDKTHTIPDHDISSLTELEHSLYRLLKQKSFTSDDLARTLNISVTELLSLISSMELSGLIQRNAVGKYQIGTG